MKKPKNQILKLLLLTVFLAFAGGGSDGQTADFAVDKQIDDLFADYNRATPGAAVAVVKNGKVVFKKGYGTANLEYDAPITTKTVFNIASVSKQFTAFSIYLLEKQGKISLEDDVKKYIREVPDSGKIIRIKHLLAHTSGVKDQASLLTLAGWRTDDAITTAQILRLLGRQKELNFEPGSRYLYSNSGYTLAAEIVGRVSGQSFSEFTKKNIFEPLEMNDTQFYDDHERVVKNRAESYEYETGVYKKKSLHDSAAGASNLYTTVEDMAKWALSFENPKVGDARLIKRFDEPSLLNDGEPVVYGVFDGENSYHAKGQILSDYRGVSSLSHGGHAAAYRSSFRRYPAQRLAIIVLSNDEHYEQLKTLLAISDLYLGDVLKPQPPPIPAAATKRLVEKSNADLKDYEGRFYSRELDTAYSAKVAGGKLFLSHIRHGDIELTGGGKDKFTGVIEFPVELEFVRNEDAEVFEMRISNWGAKNVRFEKTNDF